MFRFGIRRFNPTNNFGKQIRLMSASLSTSSQTNESKIFSYVDIDLMKSNCKAQREIVKYHRKLVAEDILTLLKNNKDTNYMKQKQSLIDNIELYINNKEYEYKKAAPINLLEDGKKTK